MMHYSKKCNAIMKGCIPSTKKHGLGNDYIYINTIEYPVYALAELNQ